MFGAGGHDSAVDWEAGIFGNVQLPAELADKGQPHGPHLEERRRFTGMEGGGAEDGGREGGGAEDGGREEGGVEDGGREEGRMGGGRFPQQRCH